MAETEPWRIELQGCAETCLSRFLDANPEYAVDDDQPDCRGGTNFITFGSFKELPVVFKYYCRPDRKEQEKVALELFAPTALTPKLYPGETDLMLIMERFSGTTLTMAEANLTGHQIEQIYHELGRVMARIVHVAPHGVFLRRHNVTAKPGFDYRFYCQADLSTLFDTVTECASKVLAEQDVPHKGILDASLSALRHNRDAILAYPSFLQIDDFHSHNIIVDGSQLRGFIDLEMTRLGNEVLLLAAAMVMTADKPMLWSSLCRGYQKNCQMPMDTQIIVLAQIAAPFSQWIRFMWYWTTDPNYLEAGEKTREWPIRSIRETVEKLRTITP